MFGGGERVEVGILLEEVREGEDVKPWERVFERKLNGKTMKIRKQEIPNVDVHFLLYLIYNNDYSEIGKEMQKERIKAILIPDLQKKFNNNGKEFTPTAWLPESNLIVVLVNPAIKEKKLKRVVKQVSAWMLNAKFGFFRKLGWKYPWGD